MSLATCSTCGNRYQRDEPWKRTCLPCWKKRKRAEQNSAPGTSNELLKARLEILKLQAELSVLRLATTRAIEPGMLAQLIRLCHPDKHGNSQGSNKATAWLLGQRSGVLQP
ncbi:MAG: hypothetical protein IPJ48_11015 [Propionivibrio sp.]|uniref:Uncharacterized protein n=1 Tax=Candidatus Propionivibrio dominans TaxID=2954373 RepID=A0A9D7FBW6_9RHOO|nr:hypothetical protein [Candidatus Propionivibrio dominans]